MTSCAFVAPSTAVQMSGDAGISAFPDGDNLFTWIGTISGSDGTVRANSGHIALCSGLRQSVQPP